MYYFLFLTLKNILSHAFFFKEIFKKLQNFWDSELVFLRA